MRQTGLKLAYLLAVLNAVIIGFSFLFAKIALDYAPPLDTLTYRFAISFAVMLIPVAFGWLKFDYRRKPLFKVLLLAAMYPLGFFTLQAFGLQYASSAEGGILCAFTPVVTTTLASLFLKESTTLLQKQSIFLSTFGVVFIFLMNGQAFDFAHITGISLLLLSSVAFAGYAVLARSLSKHFRPAEISFFMLAAGCASFLTVSVTNHAAAGTLGLFLAPLASSTFILSVLFLGILSSLVTALTANYVLSKIEASKMSAFTNLSTVVSIAAGALVLGEEVTVYHLVGSAMIVAGVIGTNRSRRKRAVLPIVQADRVEA
ncbi:DMT family transporter [Paenibacillus sp. sptzw28]|uniref:DMT family transporter n=1 Tax=Paenibacillus sp. sptzw28 TaxID=715179 RepID=UPI001C6E3A83|nr:DMT family transporter [Paenibacillus sp. sptzw28]QYR24281.1 DMT family transporter [Paenibacillus sp. sptzw28]